MIPLAVLVTLQAPFVATDAGLSWRFSGTVQKARGRYDLVGKGFRGEVCWFSVKNGRFDAEKLYKSDTLRTKEADAAKGFSHVYSETLFAGVPAIRSDQRYQWNGVAVVSRCVYAAVDGRAWIVRLWWPGAAKSSPASADAFLKTVRRLP